MIVQPPAQPSHRFGLRGMLSNLIWGSPPKKDADPEDDGEQDAEDQQPVGDGVHVISDDDDDNEGSNDGDAQMDEDVQDDGRPSSSNRLSAREKGKGRADARQVSLCSSKSATLLAQCAQPWRLLSHTDQRFLARQQRLQGLPDHGGSARPSWSGRRGGRGDRDRQRHKRPRQYELNPGPLLRRERLDELDCRGAEAGRGAAPGRDVR